MRHRQCLAVLADGFLVAVFGHQRIALFMEMLRSPSPLGAVIELRKPPNIVSATSTPSTPASNTTGFPTCSAAPGRLSGTLPMAYAATTSCIEIVPFNSRVSVLLTTGSALN